MAKRLQVDLTDEAYEALRQTAGDRSLSEVVRQALRLESALKRASDEGSEIFIKPRGDGPPQRVLMV